MFNLSGITFANQWVLWLIPVAALLFGVWWWFVFRRKNFVTLTVSNTEGLRGFENPVKGIARKILPLLSLLSVIFLLIAIARPQSTFDEEKISTEGIDLVIAVDISTSMLAQDFKPNRLEAAKKESLDFIDGRPQDRIGLVVFAGESFTQCPVTISHAVVKNQLKNVKNGILEDGTAIGMGLATAVQRLKESEAKSKVVILMTDGVNNRGLIDPATAAEIAMNFGVRVYTIGVGTNGTAYTPVAMTQDGQMVFDYAEVQIDEALLKDVAKKTGGQYFRATNNGKLKEIYSEIDKLEKTKINVSAFQRKTERFYLFAMIGALLLFIQITLRNTWLKSLT